MCCLSDTAKIFNEIPHGNRQNQTNAGRLRPLSSASPEYA
jgi:hypothetical protein